MKSLSTWEPWATLIMIGAKKWETRGHYIRMQGENICMHASKTLKGLELVAAMPARERQYIMDALREAGIYDMRDLPFGAMLGVVEIAGCWRTWDIKNSSILLPDEGRERELAMGDFSDGRFGWYMRDPFKFAEPIPARGQQGLFDWEIPQDAYTYGLGARLARRQFEPIWVRR